MYDKDSLSLCAFLTWKTMFKWISVWKMLDCIIRQFFIKKKFMRSFMDVFSYKYNKKEEKST